MKKLSEIANEMFPRVEANRQYLMVLSALREVRDEALEEAEKVAADRAVHWNDSGFIAAAEVIAARIRALREGKS